MTTVDKTGASAAEFEARVAPFEAEDRWNANTVAVRVDRDVYGVDALASPAPASQQTWTFQTAELPVPQGEEIAEEHRAANAAAAYEASDGQYGRARCPGAGGPDHGYAR